MTDQSPQHLDSSEFIRVVNNTPLVAIDIIVINFLGEVLLGLRNNEPAKDFWFVPGGRILKNEPIFDAFHRISKKELNVTLEYNNASFLGVYEHFYSTNFMSEPGIDTHYVTLAFTTYADIGIEELPQEQHSGYRWVNLLDIPAASDIHDYTKAYFPLKGVSTRNLIV